MFTGLIEDKALVVSNHSTPTGKRLIIHAPFIALPVLGESIAVNGVCLTCCAIEGQQLSFDLSPETLAITCMATLQEGGFVNVERAMAAHARFGGHYVSGHIDCTASLIRSTAQGNYREIEVSHFTAAARPFLLVKGSIALDGVSLTINRVEQESISLMLVPHTQEKTTLGQLSCGHRFNVEFDYLTRIVAHQLGILAPFNNEVFS